MTWTPDTSRRQAIKCLADPTIAERSTLAGAATLAATAASPLFAAVAEAFFADHGPNLKPRTLEEYRRHHRLYLLPKFATVPIQDITRSTIKAPLTEWKAKTPRAANHALAVLSSMLTWAEHEDQGYRPEGSRSPAH